MSQFLGRTFRSYKAQRAQRSQPRESEPRGRTREGEAMEAQIQQFQARKMMARNVAALQGQMPVEPNERQQLLQSLHKRVADVEKRMKQLRGSPADGSPSSQYQRGLSAAAPQQMRSGEKTVAAGTRGTQPHTGWAIADRVVYAPHVPYKGYPRRGSYEDRVLEQHMLADINDDGPTYSSVTPLSEHCREPHCLAQQQLAPKVSELFAAFESSSFGRCSPAPPCAIPVTMLESKVLSSTAGTAPSCGQVVINQTQSEESLRREDSDIKKRKRPKRRRKKPNNH